MKDGNVDIGQLREIMIFWKQVNSNRKGKEQMYQFIKGRNREFLRGKEYVT